MQALVYLFIALAGFAIGAMTYFALSFTLAEAILVALVVACIATLVTERRLRLRAEKRLERGIEDLSRLLATDAQAGSVLGRRINALSELNPGQRLETIEADISVLGTVIRQVAEAVAEIEEKGPRRLPFPPAIDLSAKRRGPLLRRRGKTRSSRSSPSKWSVRRWATSALSIISSPSRACRSVVRPAMTSFRA